MGQHTVAQAGGGLKQLGEPPGPLEQRSDQQRRPLLAQQLEAGSRLAVGTVPGQVSQLWMASLPGPEMNRSTFAARSTRSNSHPVVCWDMNPVFHWVIFSTMAPIMMIAKARATT